MERRAGNPAWRGDKALKWVVVEEDAGHVVVAQVDETPKMGRRRFLWLLTGASVTGGLWFADKATNGVVGSLVQQTVAGMARGSGSEGGALKKIVVVAPNGDVPAEASEVSDLAVEKAGGGNVGGLRVVSEQYVETLSIVAEPNSIELPANRHLYEPVKNRRLTKAFGVPVKYQSTGYHTGADYGGFVGEPLLAVADAEVGYVGWLYFNKAGLGRGPHAVILKWIDADSGVVMRAIYSHNSKAVVSVGQTVSHGQKIAEMGSLGYSSGPHLHFEIYRGGDWTGNPASPLENGTFDDPESYFD